MTQNTSEWLRIVATENDRALLNEIARHDGDASMSATIRRLIRDEAKRRGIQIAEQPKEMAAA